MVDDLISSLEDFKALSFMELKGKYFDGGRQAQ